MIACLLSAGACRGQFLVGTTTTCTTPINLTGLLGMSPPDGGTRSDRGELSEGGGKLGLAFCWARGECEVSPFAFAMG